MTRSELRRLQWQKLRAGLDRVWQSNAFYQQKYSAAGLESSQIATLDDLSLLPFTTKEELLADQQAFPLYGSNLTEPIESYVRMHQTSGTSGRRLRWMDTAESWGWFRECWQEIYDAIGVLPSDRFFFPFSFGPFLAFWAAFEGACARECFTLAGGGMTSIARLQAISEHRMTVVCATPTYARHLLQTAEEESFDLRNSTVRLLVLAGEPGASIPVLRRQLEEGWGARVIDHSGMTEVGSLGTEFLEHPGKLFLLEDQCIPEFIDPNTGESTAEGELGEMVLTNLGRWGSPLIRYRTGYMVRWRNNLTAAGKSFVYLDGGILGRADDMLYIKGNNVYPSSIEAVIREHDTIAEFAIEVDDGRYPPSITLVIEPKEDTDIQELRTSLGRSFQDRLYFRPEIRIVSTDSLPRFELKARRIKRIRPTSLSND